MATDKTLHEYEIAFWQRETGSASTNHQELRKLYYDLRVGVNPKTSTDDKELAYLRTKTGLPTGSKADLQAAYYFLVTGVRSAGNQNKRDYYKNAPVGH